MIAPVSCVDNLLATTSLHAFDSVQPVLHLSTNVNRQSVSTQILHLGDESYDSCVLSQHVNDEPVHTRGIHGETRHWDVVGRRHLLAWVVASEVRLRLLALLLQTLELVIAQLQAAV